MKTLYLDIESYCEVPINNGTYAYAEAAEVMLLAWAIDDGPVDVWDATLDPFMPEPLEQALAGPDTLVCAHNSSFDRTVLRHALGVDISLTRWRDTMVKALAHSLPGALGTLCEILGVPTDKAKDKAGRQLVLLFCKPRPEASKIRRATRETHPAEWARFVEYARLDVDAMREIDRKLPAWNYEGAELALWHLDQQINDRGMLVDLDLAKAAIAAVKEAQDGFAERTQDLTLGLVGSSTQRDVLLKHLLEAYGVALPDLQQSTIERRVQDPNLPAELRELLAIRLQASATSTSKYQSLMRGVSRDGRLRGTLQFDGASRTGRWAGRLFQPQNLPRPTMRHGEIEAGIEALKAGCTDIVFPDVMALTSNAIRGCIIAPPGRKLVAADLSNIEGRKLAWLAGERWKLDAFRAFDAGAGPDLYKLAYAKSFGIDPDDVDRDQRQVGKVQELALGYEGGVGAFVTFAAVYGIDLEAMADAAVDVIDEAILNEARSALAWTKLQKRPRFGLSDRAWLVCDSFKRAWRNAHPAIVAFWADLENAAIFAIRNPGKPVTVQRLRLQRDGSWLRIRLPSGRCLCYPGARVEEDGKVSYMGVDQYTRKWQRLRTYGGKLAENITQAASRDVIGDAMPEIEAHAYEIVLTVHDEIVTEAPDDDDFSADNLAGLMARNPPWATGLPLAAKGFEGARYGKPD